MISELIKVVDEVVESWQAMDAARTTEKALLNSLLQEYETAVMAGTGTDDVDRMPHADAQDEYFNKRREHITALDKLRNTRIGMKMRGE